MKIVSFLQYRKISYTTENRRRPSPKAIFLITYFCFCANAWASQLTDYRQIKCVIHIHTDMSSGTRTLESYAEEAKQKGIEAIVVTDEDWRRWEYGLPPFRRWIKKVVQEKSVMTFGIEKYLNQMQAFNESNHDIIIIDGVETNPFYYWSGNFLNGTLALNNRNKDMLVIGLGSADDYRNMPSVANYKSKFDAYHGDQFTRPYQELIDYIIKKGGLVFWSHPGYEENTLQDGVRLITAPYQWDLVGTHSYTGFGIFWEGYEKIGKPESIWDRVLTEYCEGQRHSPVWAIGELEEEGLGNKNFDDLVNVLYVNGFNRKEIMDALRKGRYYVVFKLFDRVPLVLEEFTVSNESNTKTAIMGEAISFSEDPVIKFRIAHAKHLDEKIMVKLIRNNKVIEEFSGDSQIDITYKDKGLEENKQYYYRLDVVDYTATQLIANPIFFEKLSLH